MHCSPGQGVNPNTPHADTGHYWYVWGLHRTQNQGSLAAKNEQNLLYIVHTKHKPMTKIYTHTTFSGKSRFHLFPDLTHSRVTCYHS